MQSDELEEEENEHLDAGAGARGDPWIAETGTFEGITTE